MFEECRCLSTLRICPLLQEDLRGAGDHEKINAVYIGRWCVSRKEECQGDDRESEAAKPHTLSLHFDTPHLYAHLLPDNCITAVDSKMFFHTVLTCLK